MIQIIGHLGPHSYIYAVFGGGCRYTGTEFPCQVCNHYWRKG